MGSYLDNIFVQHINRANVNTIFELGSRDLKDASLLFDYYNTSVYAFECNPDCLVECRKTFDTFDSEKKKHITLIDKAVSLEEGDITFYSFDLEKYNNMGSSSMFKIDFSKRDISDPDYNRECPQKEVVVKGIRLDNFLIENNLTIDLLCMDLQGYELNALKSLGEKLKDIKYVISEASITNTYSGGANFKDLNDYLCSAGFNYVCSNVYGSTFPDLTKTGFSEFDVLYKNNSIL